MSQDEDSDDCIKTKVILLGESGVGKTSLINAVDGKSFDPRMLSTFSTTFIKKIYKIDSQKYQVNLWDTAGQERYRQLTKLFYKGSDIVIFVYDITSKESFNHLGDWLKEVKDIIENKYICALVGNKNDLYFEEKVKEEEAKIFAHNNNIKFQLVSAKDDPQSFEDFIKELVKDAQLNLEEKVKNTSLKKNKKKKNKCKC